jgi:aspartyl aminopeptidase
MGSTLVRILDILSRVDVAELTERFVELYQAVVDTLSPMDQETAKEALAAKRLDNDEAHARLQALLAEAASR